MGREEVGEAAEQVVHEAGDAFAFDPLIIRDGSVGRSLLSFALFALGAMHNHELRRWQRNAPVVYVVQAGRPRHRGVLVGHRVFRRHADAHDGKQISVLAAEGGRAGPERLHPFGVGAVGRRVRSGAHGHTLSARHAASLGLFSLAGRRRPIHTGRINPPSQRRCCRRVL